MTSSVAAFAHLASSASRARARFESTQVIESGGLRVESFIRRSDPRLIHVEYKAYQSPWAELQEALSGQVELVGEELCGLTLDYDGQNTWVVDSSANTATRRAFCHHGRGRCRRRYHTRARRSSRGRRERLVVVAVVMPGGGQTLNRNVITSPSWTT